jgi:hypothetical protein
MYVPNQVEGDLGAVQPGLHVKANATLSVRQGYSSNKEPDLGGVVVEERRS